MVNILDCPDEVLVIIAEFISDRQSLSSWLFTCRRLYAIGNDEHVRVRLQAIFIEVIKTELESFEVQRIGINAVIKHGSYQSWHDKDKTKPKRQSSYRFGKRHGLTEHQHPNGKRRIKAYYRDGKPHGLYTVWHPNGNKIGEFYLLENAIWDGKHRTWYPDGKLKRETHYKDGKICGSNQLWSSKGRLIIDKYYRENEYNESRGYSASRLIGGCPLIPI